MTITNVDASDNRRCRPLKEADIRYVLTPLTHINGLTCAARTIGMNLSTFILLVWHRGKAKANRLLANMPPEARTTHESTRRFPLPYEILEMITAHLTHDLRALKTCSLTCRSWYTLVVLHLHHTLTITGNSDGPSRRGLEPLSKLHELGLIPLVKELRIRRRPSTGSWGFGPQAFGPRDLGYFTALANVQFLRFHDLEVNRFLPGVERYFGHLSPTLRSISVSDPRGTPQELSHFLSLFPNLDDVEIQGSSSMSIPLTTPGLTNLVPLSAPKLRGRLVLHNFRWAETWAYFITSSSGPRFRYIDLGWRTGCASVLFEECAKTLETLRYNATDTTISKQFCIFLFIRADCEQEISVYHASRFSGPYSSRVGRPPPAQGTGTVVILSSWRYSQPLHPLHSLSLFSCSRTIWWPVCPKKSHSLCSRY